MIPEGDMSGLLAQAQAMQQQLFTAQQELAETEVRGSAGGGLVTARMTGTGELVGLTIKPEAVDPDDTETLADLVLAAVRDAGERAQQLAAHRVPPARRRPSRRPSTGLGARGGQGEGAVLRRVRQRRGGRALPDLQ